MSIRSSLRFFRPLLGAVVVCSLAPAANAGEVKGVKFPDKIMSGENGLVLNGTAVRSVWGFSVYVAGLYLSEKTQDDQVIMTKNRERKRMHLTMLRDVGADKFLSTIEENIDTNFSATEKKLYEAELKAFMNCFGGDLELKEGAVVTIDFLPAKGTRVCVEGRECAVIPGDEFYHAILRLWIGTPPQESVKLGLLGKAD